MKVKLLSTVLCLQILCSYGQDIKYLYYSNRNNLSGKLIIFNDTTAIVSTPYSFYLLNKERVIVDTLDFEVKRTNIHQIQRIAIIDENTISAASFFKSMLISVNGDSFVVDKKVILDKEFKKQNGNPDLIQLFPEGIIIRSKKEEKVKDKNSYRLIHYFKPYGEKVIYNNITPPLPVKTEYLRYISFGYNSFIYAEKFLIFVNKELNKLYFYSFENRKTKIVSLPEVTRNSEVNDFFYDIHTKKYYIVNYRKNNQTRIFEFFPEKNTSRLIKQINFNVSGIVSGKIHILGSFEGSTAHYLIPLKGDVEPVKLLKNEE